MIVIGIVGSPAGGKSTVAARLQELGATWINADLIARSVLQEPAVRSQLVDHFGAKIEDNEGLIDRATLADLVFGDDDSNRAALTYLEQVIHPRTRQIIRERLRESANQHAILSILDVPLLFESKWDLACDQVWCVVSDFDKRLDRATQRGWDARQLKRREANQLSIENKRRRSTRTIDNNDSLASLIQQVDAAYQQLIIHPLADDQHCI